MKYSILNTLIFIAVLGFPLAHILKSRQRIQKTLPQWPTCNNPGTLQIINIPNEKYGNYVFDNLYVLDIHEHGIVISSFREHDLIKNAIHPIIRQCPIIEISKFGSIEINRLITDGKFSFSATKGHSHVHGIVQHNDGYSVLADGAYWRRIEHVKIEGEMINKNLKLTISIFASPVSTILKNQPPGTLSKTDKEPFIFSRNFVFPENTINNILKPNKKIS